MSSRSEVLHGALFDESYTSFQKREKKFRMDGPDGIWAWIVAFANFLVNFIIVGLGRMSGILYVDFMHLFHIDRKTASLPFSIQQAARNLFGPLAGILGQKYGVRAVTIAGGIIGAISAVTGYFVLDIFWITLMWGLVFGISTALTTTINQVSIDQHFEKHRATAGGLAFSGGCVGAFLFPVVLETLIANYGMSGAFLVMGVIIFLVVPTAILLGKPSWKKRKKMQSNRQANMNTKPYYGTIDINPGLSNSEKKNNCTDNTSSPNQAQDGMSALYADMNFELVQENDELVFILLTMDISANEDQEHIPGDLQVLDKILVGGELQKMYSFLASVQNHVDISDSMPGIVSKEIEKAKIASDQKLEITNPVALYFERDSFKMNGEMTESERNESYNEISRSKYILSKLKDLYEADEFEILLNFPSEDRSLISILLLQLKKLFENFMLAQNTFILQRSTTQESSDEETASVTSQDSDEYLSSWRQSRDKDSNTFKEHIKTAVKLHVNPLFLLICLCRGVFMLTFIPVVTIAVDFAMDKGLEKSDGKYIIAALSLGDFLGRLCLGWINDKGLISLPRYMLIVMIILAASTVSLPFMHSRASFIIAILIFGILQGSLFVRHPILISKYMNSNEHSIGMGFINLLSGFLGFALPAFIGYFRDTLGSYDKMFYVSGAICAAVGLMWAFEPCFVKFSSNHSYQKLKGNTNDIS